LSFSACAAIAARVLQVAAAAAACIAGDHVTGAG